MCQWRKLGTVTMKLRWVEFIIATTDDCSPIRPGPWFNIKMSSYQYRKYHCGDKTVVRSSYIHSGISYTGKMTSLYWIRALITVFWVLPMFEFYQHLRDTRTIIGSPHGSVWLWWWESARFILSVGYPSDYQLYLMVLKPNEIGCTEQKHKLGELFDDNDDSKMKDASYKKQDGSQ